jgi:hypothetical protein
MNRVVTFRVLLKNLSELDELLDLYLCEDQITIGLDSEILLVNSESKPKNKKCKYLIGMYDVFDILDNLNQQVTSPTNQQILDSINFYLENDAYIEV